MLECVAAPALEADAAQSNTDETVAALETLVAIARIARACVGPKITTPPSPELLELALGLHDIIFDLQDSRASVLQNAIVQLCEAWWLGERAGREDLVPQAISYLLVRVLQ